MKILRFLSCLIALFQYFPTSAQWQQQSGVPITNLFDIKAYDNQFIYSGGNNCIVRTLNGGNSWDSLPLVDLTGNFIPGFLENIHFISPNEGFASGLMFIGNNAAILRTVNGGSNWSLVYQDNFGSLPRFLNNFFFLNSSSGYAVGAYGRILKTVNGGINWNLQSISTTNELTDVHFTSSSVGYVTGNGLIAKTTNGGSTWTISNVSGFLNALDFPSTLTGFAVGNNKTIYKTTDGGSNWISLSVNLPGTFNFTSIDFTSNTSGYVTTSSGTVYKTTDGGIFWEKHETGIQLNSISFSSSSDGWMCGENGKIYRTINSGNPYHPVANFSFSPSVICQDSTINFTNLSATGLTYSWRMNNQVFATSYNTSTQIPFASQTDTVMLVISNGSFNDSISAILSIQSTLQIPTFSVTHNNNICSGQTVQFMLSSSQIGTVYTLRNNFSNVGVSQNGNGSALIFNTPSINGNTIFNIRGVRTVSGCGSDSLVQLYPITTANPDSGLTILPANISICKNDSVTISLLNSKVGTTYQLRLGTTNVGNPKSGNGGTLLFQTGPVSVSGTFNIKATGATGCFSTMMQTILVNVELINAAFGLSNLNPETGENIFTLNSTQNSGGTFSWNFGAAASPQFSWFSNVSNLSFSTSGIYIVSLAALTPAGCKDTAYLSVTVHNPSPNDSIILSSMTSNSSNVNGIDDLAYDPTDNGLIAVADLKTMDLITYGTNGDTIRNFSPYIQNEYDGALCMVRFNSKGKAMWMNKVLYESGPKPTQVETDSQGNIYWSWFHYDHIDSVKVFSSDSTYFAWKPILQNSLYPVIVIKFNKMGIYQWHRFNYATQSNLCTSFYIDKYDNIYSLTGFKIVKWDSNGQVLSTVTATGWNSFCDLSVDSLENISVLLRQELIVEKYDSMGNFISATSPINTFGSGTTFAFNSTMDTNGNNYVLGQSGGPFLFNGDTVSANGGNVFFFMKLGPAGQQLWLSPFYHAGGLVAYNIIVKGDRVFAYYKNSYPADTCFFPGLPALSGSNAYYFLVSCDTSGNNMQVSKIYESNSQMGSLYELDAFAKSPINDEIALGFQFKSTVSAGGNSINPYTGFSPQNGNNCVLRGNVNYLMQGSVPQSTPNSFFANNNGSYCTGSAIQFNDMSDQNPTSWLWSMPGGNPTSSTNQNPSVVYNSPGTYTISLTASNGIGTGTTYSMQIIVGSSSAISITGNSSICLGQSVNLVATGDTSFYWNNGMTGASINVSPLFTTTYSVVSGSGACSAFDSITINVNSVPSAAITTSDSLNICQGEIVDMNATSGFSSYQWYRWNNIVPGANTSNYSTSQGGLYKVKVTDANGCSAFTNALRVRIVCIPIQDPISKITHPIKADSQVQLIIFPNPSTGKFLLKTNCETINSIEIFSLDFKIIPCSFIQTDDHNFEFEALPAGMYLVNITCNNKRNVIKFVSTGN